jgi:hypothetical protein
VYLFLALVKTHILRTWRTLFTSSDGISGGDPEVVDDVGYLLCFQPPRGGEFQDRAVMADMRGDLPVRA